MPQPFGSLRNPPKGNIHKNKCNILYINLKAKSKRQIVLQQQQRQKVENEGKEQSPFT